MSEKINLKDIEKEILRESAEIEELNGKRIIFNPNVSCKRVFMVCQRIVENIFNPNGTYLPKLKDILIFCFIVDNMTNIPIKRDKNKNIDTDFVYNLMLSNIGKKLIKEAQSCEIFSLLSDEITELINYKKQIYLKELSPQNQTLKNLDTLIFEIQNAVQKISSFTDEHKNFMSSVNFTKMIEVLENVKAK